MYRTSTWLLNQHLRPHRVRFNNEGGGTEGGEGGAGGGSGSGSSSSGGGNQSGQGGGTGSSDQGGSGGSSGDGGTGGKDDKSKPPADGPKVTLSEAELQAKLDAKAAETRRAVEAEGKRKDKEKQGEFEGLYKDEQKAHETTKGELKTAQDQLKGLQEFVNGAIDTQIKDWPDSIKALDPGKDNLQARQAWVTKATAAAEEVTKGKTAPPGEMGSGSQGGQGGDLLTNYLKGQTYSIPGQKTA